MSTDILSPALLEKMVQKKLIQREAIAVVLQEQKTNGKTLSELLCARELIAEKELTQFLCNEFGFTPIKLSALAVEPAVIKLIPSQFALKNSVIPISLYENVLTVTMMNPMDLNLIDDLQAITNYRIKPVITEFSELKKAIDQYYGKEAKFEVRTGTNEETIEDLIKIVQDSKNEESSSELNDLMRQAQETPIIKVANLLLVDGIKRKASDVFIEPWEDSMRVRYRVDGLLEEGKAPPKIMGQAIVSRFKVMSQLNIAERRMPQDGRFKIKVQEREVDIRVSILPTSFGEKVCLRILDKKTQTQSIEKLGFTNTELEEIKKVSLKPHGMVLVTGPTGSGKTTTLYSILKYLDSPEKNITTVEDPVEYQVEGINQVNIRDKIGLTFPIALRSILRQDPNIILIGEIRDAETMDIAMKAALTGHLVLSSLHTNDTSGSIVRMVNMGIEPYLIASSVLMVSAQRLLRRLCLNCRISYTPENEILKKLKLPTKKNYTFYQPGGCARCRNMGYLGRTVITEILAMKSELKDMIMRRVTGEELKQASRRVGMTTLRESALNKVVSGETSLEEMLRVTSGDQDLENDLVNP